MDTSARSSGAAIAIVGVILWVIAVAVDAALVAVIIPILMVMGGALLMVQTGRRSGTEN